MFVDIKKVKTEAIIPTYGTSGSAGADLYACLDEDMVLQPGEIKLVPTGIMVELPLGYEMQIRPRSGLAIKNNISVANSPGTVDSDFRSEVMVILQNRGTLPFVVKHGMRIAQAVVSTYTKCVFHEVDELSDTERGTGGFGSTGL